MDAHPRAETITPEITDLRTLLSDVNAWRRRGYLYLEQIKWNIEALGLPIRGLRVGVDEEDDYFDAAVETPTIESGENTATTAKLTDFKAIFTSLHLTQRRIQSLLPVVLGAFGLLEAQHSVLKADLTIRLTSVGLIFIPLSHSEHTEYE